MKNYKVNIKYSVDYSYSTPLNNQTIEEFKNIKNIEDLKNSMIERIEKKDHEFDIAFIDKDILIIKYDIIENSTD